MKKLLVFYFIVMLISVVRPFIASATCDHHLYSGNFLSNQHKIRLALNEYRQAYAVCGNSFESLAGLARALNDLGEELSSDKSYGFHKQALNIANIMVKFFPDRSDSHFLRAVSLGNLALLSDRGHQAKLAIKIKESLDYAMLLDPSNIGVYIGKGILYRNIASLDPSSRILAFMFFSDLPRATFKNAMEILKKGLEIDGNVPRLHYEIALVYLQNNEPELALRHFTFCIAMDERDHQDTVIKERAQQYIVKIDKG